MTGPKAPTRSRGSSIVRRVSPNLRHSNMRSAGLASLLLLLCAKTSAAQSNAIARLDLTVQASLVPLHSGDATVGGYRGLGPSVRLAFHPGLMDRRLFVEGFFTRTSSELYRGKPGLKAFGIQLGAVTTPAKSGVQGTFAAGIGRLLIDPVPLVMCEPPSCIAEGGGNFRKARLTTVVADAGIIFPSQATISARVDGRIHIPIGASEGLLDSGRSRFEIAAGLMLHWR